MPTVADLLFKEGFTRTAWKDVTTGRVVNGKLDLTVAAGPARYGAPAQIKGWPQQNLVGGHATGANEILKGMPLTDEDTP